MVLRLQYVRHRRGAHGVWILEAVPLEPRAQVSERHAELLLVESESPDASVLPSTDGCTSRSWRLASLYCRCCRPSRTAGERETTDRHHIEYHDDIVS